jgi:hypothetical protein
MANVRLDRRLAELESKAAAANGGKLHVLYAPVGLYDAELDAWREQEIAKLPPGANVLTVCFVRPGDPVRDPPGKKPALRGSAAAGEGS